MKNTLIVLFILIMSSNYSFSQYTLEIEITPIRNNVGKIMLQVFNEKENVIAEKMGTIKEQSCSFSVKNLKPGKYAIRYYHDENLNSVMETNMVGKPTEGYGFSNNVTDTFGPPPFEKWLFVFNGDKKVVLKPVY